MRTSSGLAVLQTTDFGDDRRKFGQFDLGDGGQVAVFSDTSVSMGLTEDGGAGLQFFLGPNCQAMNAWVIVDRRFATQPAGDMVARITRNPAACPGRMGYAFTQWDVQPVDFRTSSGGRQGHAVLSTLITEHYGGHTIDAASNMERMYFTRELGYTRWERWQNVTRRPSAADRQAAVTFARTGRCEPQRPSPSTASEWVMIDCREWTQMAPPAAPGGDPASFWLDRLRRYPITQAMFPGAE